MKYDIGISYITDIPEEFVLDLARALREANVKVEVESRPNEPFMGLEWAIPAAIILYIGKPYIDQLLKEAATDHYRLAKGALSKFARLALTIKQQMIVSSQSPNKLRSDNRVSNSFTIDSKTIDGRPIKFLFLPDRDEAYYQTCTDQIFNVLLDHARDYPDDSISNQAKRLPRKSREIYMLFDESTKTWKTADIGTGLIT